MEGWTPGEGFWDAPEKIKVSLLFSRESNKAKTEQAFSLAEDGKTLNGSFVWQSRRLVFFPASPLEAEHDYFLTLETGAQDTEGLSLEKKFEASFTTRRPGGKPKVIRTEPEHEGILTESREEFRLFFSEPVTADSCQDSISFSPSTPGSWRLEDEDKTACFTPREPWQAGNLYRVKVDSGFRAASGFMLGTDYLTHFSAGADREKPVLLKVLALTPGGEEEICLEKPGASNENEYAAWESYTKLCLVFSEPVDLSGLKSLLTTEPSAAIVMESPPEMSSRVVFRLSDPEWGSSFLFRLDPGVKDTAGNESDEEYLFRIKISGPYSKPPAFVGMRLPMAPGKTEDQEPLSFSQTNSFARLPIENKKGRYPLRQPIPAWIELYFECAPDTEIDSFSVMDLFRVESPNRALTFSPLSVRNEDFTLSEPKEGWEHLYRLEILGSFTNTVQTGIVTFRIPPGLKDNRGNRSAVDFRFSFLK